MTYLIDTNILSEIQKGPSADERVLNWWNSTQDIDLYPSVVAVGEVYRGIEKLLRIDPRRGQVYLDWIRNVTEAFRGRILGVDLDSAIAWGKITSGRSLPLADAMLAATAISHNLVLVTRNTRDIRETGVQYLNPFEKER